MTKQEIIAKLDTLRMDLVAAESTHPQGRLDLAIDALDKVRREIVNG